MEKKYDTTWCQEDTLPKEGIACPKCKDGVVDVSQYGGMWCRSCRWKWRISNYPAKNLEVQRPGDRDFHEEQVIPVGDLAPIYDELKKILTEIAKIETEIEGFKAGQKIMNDNIMSIAGELSKRKQDKLPVIED